ncbi:UNVERIFIED_CONTAM: Cysteine proteinase inhibitor 12 [Sesamum angustifolium]|uniref:Cysteine proteinase inhibitor n=1 Tax=Sesamum angustifolium TaxID=2727405 RepID=A0AAW2LGU8_9LAMI
MRALPFSIFLILSAALLSSFVLPQHNLGLCPDNDNQVIHMATLGGVHDSHSLPNPDTHSSPDLLLTNTIPKRVVEAREQVVAGTLHHLILEVLDAGQKKLYEAKVWVKPWMDFKQLQEFKHVRDVPSFTSSDLGAKTDDQVSGWRPVPVHDPVVQDAAHHAIKTIQERSNSLFPYELSEVVHANAEVVDTSAKFDLLLKVKRGGKEEKYKVEVQKDTEEGSFDLKKLDLDHS